MTRSRRRCIVEEGIQKSGRLTTPRNWWLDNGCVGGDAVIVVDDNSAELNRAREQIRDHWALLTSLGKDPIAGTTWGPDRDEYVRLLRGAAQIAGISNVPILPWSNRMLVEFDEQCSAASVVSGPPLLP